MKSGLALALSVGAGAVTVFGFAPFHLALLPIVSLATLFWLWQRVTQPRTAAALGFAFGVGLFGAGASWVYIALETFGGMPAPIALVGTAVWVAYLSLWPALAGWVAVRSTRQDSVARALAAAGAWTLTEWLRGSGYTGFPWLSIGYAELLPSGATPLAGFASVGGVFLVSLTVVLCAAALTVAISRLADGVPRTSAVCAIAIVALFAGGALLGQIRWTVPFGSPLTVSLVQGNVAQTLKFDPDFREQNFTLYTALARKAQGRLVVLPESAFPVFADEVPEAVLRELVDIGGTRDGDVLFGLFTLDPPLPGGDGPRYYNSVVSLGANPPQLYRKHHLVPFGETIPAKPIVGWLINRVLAIPLADQTPGPANPAPFAVAGQRIAVNICYEDAFGSELIGPARAATMLVNVTNDAWYGRSIAARQHNQIAAMRALETGRPMLRATNTGITSAIGHDGRVFAELPWFERGILEVELAGRQGDTPYVRWGDSVALGLAFMFLATAVWSARRARSIAHPVSRHGNQ